MYCDRIQKKVINPKPKIKIKKDYISANGLFRHGYLLSPVIADLVVDYCLKDKKDKNLSYIYK